MRYITITSKHHDGLRNVWHEAIQVWNIVDSTPYGKDVLKALSEECRRQGLRLFFYHSHLDWHHPDYYPLVTNRPRIGPSGRRRFSTATWITWTLS